MFVAHDAAHHADDFIVGQDAVGGLTLHCASITESLAHAAALSTRKEGSSKGWRRGSFYSRQKVLVNWLRSLEASQVSPGTTFQACWSRSDQSRSDQAGPGITTNVPPR